VSEITGYPRLTAILVLDEDAAELMETLSKRSISAVVIPDTDRALEACRKKPPHLAIVGVSPGSMTGTQFAAELLKISWATATIMVSDEDEQILHDKTEGLGILGSIKSGRDTLALEALLDRFVEIASI